MADYELSDRLRGELGALSDTAFLLGAEGEREECLRAEVYGLILQATSLVAELANTQCVRAHREAREEAA